MRMTRITFALLGSLALCLSACSHEEVKKDVGDRPLAKPADTGVASADPADTDADPESSETPEAGDPPAPAPALAGTVTLTVRGLHCEEECVPRLESMLAGAPGVRSVEIDYASKTATVAVSGDVEPERVAAAVGGGFVATVK